MNGPTWGIHQMYFPVDDFLGARYASGNTGGAPGGAGASVSKLHRYIALVALIAIGYGLWHYSMTH